MTASEEYEFITKQQNERHAVALDLNARLKADLARLEGITFQQQSVDKILEGLFC